MVTGLSVFSYYYICVPHTNIYVSWNTGDWLVRMSSIELWTFILDVTWLRHDSILEGGLAMKSLNSSLIGFISSWTFRTVINKMEYSLKYLFWNKYFSSNTWVLYVLVFVVFCSKVSEPLVLDVVCSEASEQKNGKGQTYIVKYIVSRLENVFPSKGHRYSQEQFPSWSWDGRPVLFSKTRYFSLLPLLFIVTISWDTCPVVIKLTSPSQSLAFTTQHKHVDHSPLKSCVSHRHLAD